MPVSCCRAEGLSVRQAEIQTIALVAVLLQATGGQMTVHTVVRAVTVAPLLALPVSPESLISCQVTAMAHTAAVTARYTKVVMQNEAILTLTPLLAWQGARFSWFIQVGTGQRAAAGALIKVTVFWTWKS